jgi:putative phosphoribosyl transferase
MDPHKLFRDRRDAGQQLAARLDSYRHESPLVLGLPRGGVPVAYEIASALGAPLDVCIVRKIGAPTQPELGIGAVAEGGALFVDRTTADAMGVSTDELAALIATKRMEVADRVARFRRGASPLDVRGRTVILVDDGVATGGTARVALQALRTRGAARIVLAVPVGASRTLDELAPLTDELVCLHSEAAFYALGLWYEDFSTTTDEDVVELLDRARSEAAPETRRSRSERVRARVERELQIPQGNEWLEGKLARPARARGLVVFAHGSGSTRHDERHQYVAGELQRAGLATLQLELLTATEGRHDARTGRLRFDIDLLAARLVLATDSVLQQPEAHGLPLGYFAASTSAAAALVAAARRPDVIRAIVAQGGRPDLAEASLGDVKAATLLLVGGDNGELLTLNREALYFLGCEKLLEVVPGATHDFEGPGALDHVAHSAAQWFARHFVDQALGAIA